MRLKSIQKNPHNYAHTNLQGTNNAPPGYHYMPNGTLMANSEHNLGQSYSNMPPGYIFAGLGLGGMLLTGGLIALLLVRK
jgi:hypothetical protein